MSRDPHDVVDPEVGRDDGVGPCDAAAGVAAGTGVGVGGAAGGEGAIGGTGGGAVALLRLVVGVAVHAVDVVSASGAGGVADQEVVGRPGPRSQSATGLVVDELRSDGGTVGVVGRRR